MTAPTYPPCAECGRQMIPQRLWNAADAGDCKQWRREGKEAHGARDKCRTCYARERRANRDTRPRPQRARKPAVLPDPCRCGVTLVRNAAWRDAPTAQRDEWAAAGYRPALHGTCDNCKRADDHAKRVAAREVERQAQRARAVEMRRAGASVTEIAAELGICETTARKLAPSCLAPNDSPEVLEDGQWVPRGLTQVWVPNNDNAATAA